MKDAEVIRGDCLAALAGLADNSVDAIVTDPPYGLSFMGKDWDHGVPGVPFWREALRVLKPGGHLLAFGGSRTYHRLVCAIEDAGFEIRDQIMWLYGSGFPKSKNLDGDWQGWGTALKPAHEPICVARKPLGTVDTNVLEVVELNLRSQGVTGEIRWTKENASDAGRSKETISSGSTKHSEPSETSAKSAAANATLRTEQQTPLCTVRDGTHGGGKTNHTIGNTAESWTSNCANKFSLPTEAPAHAAENASRLFLPLTTLTEEGQHTGAQSMGRSTPNYGEKDTQKAIACFAGIATGLTGSLAHVHITRLNDGSFVWPHDLPKFVPAAPLTVAANVLKWGTGAINVDGCRVGTESTVTVRNGNSGAHGRYGKDNRVFTRENPPGRWPANVIHDGSDEVLAGFPEAPGQQGKVTGREPSGKTGAVYGAFNGRTAAEPRGDTGSAARFFYCAKASRKDRGEGNGHPTVKPTDLMRYLCRLVTPPGGTVLDPFCGSGSTGKAAVLEGFRFLGVELSEEYAEIARARIDAARHRRGVLL